MAPPKITVRGAGRAKGIPQGYVLGRSSKGTGDVELLRENELRTVGIASRREVADSFRSLSFLDLIDTPSSYAGFGTYNVRVTVAETGLEFALATGGAVLPMVDGAEPPGLITSGDGQLIAVDYTP